MRRFSVVLVVLGLLLVGAGCGSDSSDGVDAGADVDAKADADVDVSGFAAKDCQEALKAMSGASSGVPQAMTGNDTDFKRSMEQFEAYADKAPKEIRADMKVLAAAYSEYAEALAKIDFKSGKTPSADDMQKLQDLAKTFDQDDLKEASQRVSDYFARGCKK